MNQDVAQIALMYVLPLGVTFITILQSAAAETRGQKMVGALLSFIVVILDCLFYFAKNSFIAYNNDGGLLLAFGSLFFFAILYIVKSEETPEKVANGIFAALMLASIVGISYWDRPTLIITSQYTPEEIAAQNAMYQDYITSFQEGTPAKSKKSKVSGTQVNVPGAPAGENVQGQKPARPATLTEGAKARLDSYMDESRKVMKRMQEVENAINSFGTLPPNIGEKEREEKSRQALAISNNAMAINKKALGLFHPHESSEAHTELIQATESLRLAAYSLYNYTLQENADEQRVQRQQAREQLAQSKVSLERFISAIQALLINYQPQQEEQ
jgi:hypothetical protein